MTSVTGRPALIDEPRSPWMMPLSPPPMKVGRKFRLPLSDMKAWAPSLPQLRTPSQPPNSIIILPTWT